MFRAVNDDEGSRPAEPIAKLPVEEWMGEYRRICGLIQAGDPTASPLAAANQLLVTIGDAFPTSDPRLNLLGQSLLSLLASLEGERGEWLLALGHLLEGAEQWPEQARWWLQLARVGVRLELPPALLRGLLQRAPGLAADRIVKEIKALKPNANSAPLFPPLAPKELPLKRSVGWEGLVTALLKLTAKSDEPALCRPVRLHWLQEESDEAQLQFQSQARRATRRGQSQLQSLAELLGWEWPLLEQRLFARLQKPCPLPRDLDLSESSLLACLLDCKRHLLQLPEPLALIKLADAAVLPPLSDQEALKVAECRLLADELREEHLKGLSGLELQEDQLRLLYLHSQLNPQLGAEAMDLIPKELRLFSPASLSHCADWEAGVELICEHALTQAQFIRLLERLFVTRPSNLELDSFPLLEQLLQWLALNGPASLAGWAWSLLLAKVAPLNLELAQAIWQQWQPVGEAWPLRQFLTRLAPLGNVSLNWAILQALHPGLRVKPGGGQPTCDLWEHGALILECLVELKPSHALACLDRLLAAAPPLLAYEQRQREHFIREALRQLGWRDALLGGFKLNPPRSIENEVLAEAVEMRAELQKSEEHLLAHLAWNGEGWRQLGDLFYHQFEQLVEEMEGEGDEEREREQGLRLARQALLCYQLEPNEANQLLLFSSLWEGPLALPHSPLLCQAMERYARNLTPEQLILLREPSDEHLLAIARSLPTTAAPEAALFKTLVALMEREHLWGPELLSLLTKHLGDVEGEDFQDREAALTVLIPRLAKLDRRRTQHRHLALLTTLGKSTLEDWIKLSPWVKTNRRPLLQVWRQEGEAPGVHRLYTNRYLVRLGKWLHQHGHVDKLARLLEEVDPSIAEQLKFP